MLRGRLTTNGWHFVLPGLTMLLLIVVVPVGLALYYSMHDVRLFRFTTQPFIGLTNYQYLITDSLFWSAMRVTFVYTFGVTFFSVFFGFVVAVFLSSPTVERLRTFYITIFLLPFVTTTVVNALAWRFFVWENEYGFVNYLLRLVGLPGQNWLLSRDLALPATVVTGTWIMAPLAVLILYAALSAIPRELIEAAVVDGAGFLQIVRHVMLPLVQNHILFVSLVILTSAFREFGLVFAMTGGGPGRTTSVMSLFVYNRGIATGNLGYASAAAFVMFIIAAIIAIAYIWLFQSRRGEAAAG